MRKYLLLLLVILSACTSVHAQKWFVFGRVGEMDSFKASINAYHLKMPRTTYVNPFFDSTGSIYLDVSTGTLYYHNGTTWRPTAGGGGGSISLTTTGVRGAATLSGTTLNIPNYSGDSTTFATRHYVNLAIDTATDYLLAITEYLDSVKQNYLDTTTWDATKANLNTLSAAIQTRLDAKQAYLDTNTWDATKANLRDTAAVLRGLIPSLTGYVPYTGATQSLNMGVYNVTTNTVVATSSAGLHLHGTGGSGIMIGAGGGDNITLDGYKITVPGDSLLTTNSSGGLLRYDMKTKLATYLLRADTASLSTRINLKLNSSDTASLSTRINLKLNSSDTASLSTRINLKQDINDTGSTDATRTWVRTTAFTLSNKTINTSRYVPRVDSISSSATPSINTDNLDYYEIKAQNANITSVTMSGTPTMGQTFCLCWTGTGPFTLTLGSNFEASSIALPTTITTTKQCAVFLYNTITLKWRMAGTF